MQRRSFFQVAGAAAATSALLLAGCKDNTVTPTEPKLALESGEKGVLTYAYILEQLEAAFYQKVVAAPPTDFSTEEKAIFQQLYEHEVLHREYLGQVLTSLGNTPPANLEFSFTTLPLSTRAGVLEAAQQLEDLGVAAYNGAAKLMNTPLLLTALAKISSVEARHAALVRDLLQPGSFAGADVVATSGDLAGLDDSKTPLQVLVEVNKFSVIQISGAELPTA
ncbi:ferritin-like domain-containing protein [Hymenobacter sp. DG25B]|uniref:ferritin-like domain-containing protein n=1 Tax=Hymenobacter sp. DG25B TaxID=1385664 RepID=UPI000662BFE7|nr:ferritin-like domain-containing protein [Hymenobacter sp. DG25B]